MTGLMRAAVLTLTIAVPAWAAEPALTGTWHGEPKQVAVHIAPCADQVCGQIVRLRDPRDAAGRPARDDKNKSLAERQQLICGLPLLHGFRTAASAGEWEGGMIYNPDDGETCKATMRLMPDGRLRVRGYVGITLFGKTETWTRAALGLPSCAEP